MTNKAGRHPLRVGEMGEIWASQLEPGKWRAGARYGAPDAGTKQIVRIAKTAAGEQPAG